MEEILSDTRDGMMVWDKKVDVDALVGRDEV